MQVQYLMSFSTGGGTSETFPLQVSGSGIGMVKSPKQQLFGQLGVSQPAYSPQAKRSKSGQKEVRPETGTQAYLSPEWGQE